MTLFLHQILWCFNDDTMQASDLSIYGCFNPKIHIIYNLLGFIPIARMEGRQICHINSIMHFWASKEEKILSAKMREKCINTLEKDQRLRNEIREIQDVIVVWNSTPHIFAFCSSKRFCATMEQRYVCFAR